MRQPNLFDPDKTVVTPCPVPGCGAIRYPGQDKVTTCEVDRDRAVGTGRRFRPKTCLNAYDPEHAEFPEGF